ncbi:hypothetical protein HanIR_Chr04g0204161 [Helianthus annuus]|nr:hypothetical protein HanIR_Chr04g0204161 [Helianthus annuus]
MIPKPFRVPHVTVLIIHPARYRVCTGRVCDNICKYEKNNSRDNQGRVAKQVQGQQALFVPIRAYEAREGEEEEENADENNGPWERADAVVIGL